MNHATLHNLAAGTSKPIKNLGWLLRHTADIHALKLERFDDGSAYLTAEIRGNRRYTTPFADYAIARSWVRRPSLRGIPLSLKGYGPGFTPLA